MRMAAATMLLFQSTLSMRRATDVAQLTVLETDVISIHALHEESDSVRASMPRASANFNPRSP